MLQLNSDGILKDRIKTIDGPAPKGSLPMFVTNKKMMDLIEGWYGKSGVGAKHLELKGRNINTLNEKYEFLNDYFTVMSEVFDQAWGRKNYVLTKAMGFDLMFAILRPVTRVAISKMEDSVRVPSKKELKEAVELLLFEEDGKTPISIYVTNGTGEQEKILLDFSSKSFGARSSGKGINELKESIADAIEIVEKKLDL